MNRRKLVFKRSLGMADYDVIWAPDALTDLEAIYDFIARESEPVAVKIVGSLFDRPLQLKTHPYSGPEESLLKQVPGEFRYLVEGHYKLIYQVLEKQVAIIQIFDSRQNPAKMKG